MARLGDLPMPLRACGREIPHDVMLRLPKWEVVTRCAFAQSLYDRAADESPEGAAKTRVTAGRVLRSLPLEEYLDELKRLDRELKAATAAEDFDLASKIFGDLLRLQVFNPEVPSALYKVAGLLETGAELEERHRMASGVLNLPKARV